MGFYDEIAKNIQWEYADRTDAYLKVVNHKLQLPNPGWLQYHLGFLDKVIEAIHAFEKGELEGIDYDINRIEKHIIKDPVEALSFLNHIHENYNVYSIDIESSNTESDRAKNRVLMIGIAYEAEKGVTFMKECFEDTTFKNAFQLFLEDKTKTFILQNGIFDRSRTQLFTNMKIRIDEDTMLMHYCGINEHKGTHGLKDMAQLYLGFPNWEEPLDIWKHEYCRRNKVKLRDFKYDYFPQELLAKYCCVDVCATYQLKYKFEKLMDPKSVNIYYKLVEASEYYSDMIVRGMKLDMNYWQVLCDDLTNQCLDLEDYFEENMPGVLLTSPKQLLEWLRKKYPYDNIESTGATPLKDLVKAHPDDCDELQHILEYRKVKKYLDTYVYGLFNSKDCDDVIHCEFKLHGTETGRLSSANPNMQNIPRNKSIKSLFIAHPGYKLLQLDYSQAELRVLAYISQDDKLMQCYIDGRDLHTEMQKQLFKDKFDRQNADQRVIAKTINFGIPYGRTAGGMSSKLGISLAQATRYLKDWFEGAPKVKDYIKKCHEDALADPQVIYYTQFGRSRHYFVTSKSVYHVRNQSVNFPISSTANDLTIYSLCAIGKWLKENNYDAYFVNTVHDSIILEVKEKDIKVISDKCQEIMATIPKMMLKDCKVPFRADAEIGDCYGNLKEPDFGSFEEDDED